MSLQSIRLRRALSSLATLHRPLSSPTATPTPLLHPPPSFPLSQNSSSVQPAFSLFQTRQFRATLASLSSSSNKKEFRVYKEGDEITEDMVLFEGCDFNHWLITVDFPKDPAPTPEEMVATYERICAEGLRISIEEAKKRIYACSTTTYQGFQAVMTEQESEQFKDVPGVVFVLPDSYIDPQNKQYGGDLYENGVITPRPPPIQYKRGGGRFRDRNSNPDQQRFDRRGSPMPNQGGSPQYSQQGRPQQNYPPQQNYGPPQNYPPQQNCGPPQNYPPQQNFGPPQNYPPQQNFGPPQNYSPQQNYGSPGQRERVPMNSGNYQANRGGQYQGNYSQEQRGNYYSQDPRGFPQGDQRDFTRENQNFSPLHAGTHGQNAGYGQGSPGEGTRLPQMEQRNIHEEQANYSPIGQTGINPGRY